MLDGRPFFSTQEEQIEIQRSDACNACVLLANESKRRYQETQSPQKTCLIQVPFREGKMLRKKQLLVGNAGVRLRSGRKQAASVTCTIALSEEVSKGSRCL